ncbi:MAG: hypothetical protein NWQ32_17840, partial [Paracoccaceae bacterium]|nr:hypothetical protein [Paracoccaceae bacterium]
TLGKWERAYLPEILRGLVRGRVVVDVNALPCGNCNAPPPGQLDAGRRGPQSAAKDVRGTRCCWMWISCGRSFPPSPWKA